MDSNKLNDLALFLGMFAGDGSLPRKHNGEGYRNYIVSFYNTKKEYVQLFNRLLLQLTGVEGKIKQRIRENKQPLWQVEKYSKKVFDMINKRWEIPDGKKARNVFVPSFIMSSNEDVKKHFLLGLFITDGGLRKDGSICFHVASEKLLINLKDIFKEIWGIETPIKSYKQKEYVSFQLNLNKKQSKLLLLELPTSHNLVQRKCLLQDIALN